METTKTGLEAMCQRPEGWPYIVSADAFKLLQTDPSILEKLEYTGYSTVTAEFLASWFDPKKVTIGSRRPHVKVAGDTQ